MEFRGQKQVRRRAVNGLCSLFLLGLFSFSLLSSFPKFAHASSDCEGFFLSGSSGEFSIASLQPSKKDSRSRVAPAIQNSAVVAKAPSVSGISAYFVMTRLLGPTGTLWDLIPLMPKFRAMGINTLWLSPSNPQTTRDWNGTENNHGYWISNHGKIADEVGGEAAYAAVKAAAQKYGIKLCADAVPDHMGYGEWHVINGVTVNGNDPKYFRVDKYLDHSRIEQIEAEFRRETDPDKLRALLKELGQFNLAGLPGLNLYDADVRRYLIDSYKLSVDRGDEVIRIDAVKHFNNQEFVSYFINELSAYSRSKGKNIQFILEFLMGTTPALTVFANDILAQVKRPEEVFFLDFPLEFEIRRIQDSGYDLRWLEGFLNYREQSAYPARNAIPMPIDHDLLPPMKDPFNTRVVYALSDFLSYNTPIIHHGSEQITTAESGRLQLNDLNPSGSIVMNRKNLTRVMGDYRFAEGGRKMLFHHNSSPDVFIAELRIPGKKSLFFAFNRGRDAFKDNVSIDGSWTSRSSQIRSVLSEAGPSVFADVHNSQLNVSFNLPPRSFIFFEVNQ